MCTLLDEVKDILKSLGQPLFICVHVVFQLLVVRGFPWLYSKLITGAIHREARSLF